MEARMERTEICKTLPDELVEMIVSMVPFPSIFKARCLSKSWLARLSSIPREENEAEKYQVATTFQKLVCERATTWKTFCPVSISSEGAIVPSYQTNKNWREMPSLSFLSNNSSTTRTVWDIAGVLLLLNEPEGYRHTGKICVANILNRTWRHLPPSPSIVRKCACWIHISKLVLIDKSLGTYKIIMLYELKRDLSSCFLVIYDSKLDLWTSKQIHVKRYFPSISSYRSAYFNGLLYIVVPNSYPLKLWTVDTEDGGDVKELQLSHDAGLNDDYDTFYFYYLLVCKGDLLMVVGNKRRCQFEVLKIDLESLTLVHLTKGPPDPLTVEMIHNVPVTDGYSIFFNVGYSERRILKYTFENDTWSLLPFSTPTSAVSLYPRISDHETIFSFQPGSNPFAAV